MIFLFQFEILGGSEPDGEAVHVHNHVHLHFAAYLVGIHSAERGRRFPLWILRGSLRCLSLILNRH